MALVRLTSAWRECYSGVVLHTAVRAGLTGAVYLLLTVLFETPPAEWVCTEKSRQLILHDEDNSSKMEGDCKRLNTLNHYQVSAW